MSAVEFDRERCLAENADLKSANSDLEAKLDNLRWQLGVSRGVNHRLRDEKKELETSVSDMHCTISRQAGSNVTLSGRNTELAREKELLEEELRVERDKADKLSAELEKWGLENDKLADMADGRLDSLKHLAGSLAEEHVFLREAKVECDAAFDRALKAEQALKEATADVVTMCKANDELKEENTRLKNFFHIC